MARQVPEPAAISISNTKKEMLEAYEALLKQLEERRQAEVKPEERAKEKSARAAVAVAEELSLEGIGREIGNLKSEIGKMLVGLSDRLEEETAKYVRIKEAVGARETELKEIYEIERAASSLAALIQAQEAKRQQFESDMAERKRRLEEEIEATRGQWLAERAAHDNAIKERDESEKKARAREAEEFKYRAEREKSLAKEQFDYEKAKLARELTVVREESDRQTSAREETLAQREAELADLRKRAEALPKELDAAVGRAIKDTTDRLSREVKAREDILQREHAAEKTVLSGQIEALQQSAKQQAEQIASLTAQLQKAYAQVQAVALKALEAPAFKVQPAPSGPADTRRPARDEG